MPGCLCLTVACTVCMKLHTMLCRWWACPSCLSRWARWIRYSQTCELILCHRITHSERATSAAACREASSSKMISAWHQVYTCLPSDSVW